MIDLKFVIMKMLSKQEMNGYALKKNLSNLLERELSSGAMYPALNKLESEKLILIQDKVVEGRYQKVYSLTDKGRLNLKGEEAVIRKLLNVDRSAVKLEVLDLEGN